MILNKCVNMRSLHKYLLCTLIILSLFSDSLCIEIKSEESFLLKREIYNLTNIDYFICEDSMINCSGSGLCNEEKDECICFQGWSTVFSEPEDYFSKKPRCNYKLKKAIYALALSLFPSFGFVHFYLGHNVLGYVQLFVFSLVAVLNITVILNLSIKHVTKVSQIQLRQTLSLSLVNCFFTVICLFWYLFDFFMLLFNVYKDKEGVNLQEMFITRN